MKQFKGYDDAKKAAQAMGGQRLAAGAYVCKILDVKYENGQNGNSDMILLRFDITEGENKDFFKSQFENNQSEDKKWKGKTTIYVPKEDGSEQDTWTKNAFAKWTDSFEQSNDGYTWDWDENKWKGLTVGIVFGDTGTVVEGKEIVYTEPRFAIAVSKVREGKEPVAKFKAKNGYTGNGSSTTASNNDFMNVSSTSEDEVPW